MMTRRKVVLGGLIFVAPLLVVAAACSFPEVSFGEASAEEAGAEEETGSPEAAAPDVVDDDDPYRLPDGGSIGDVAVRDDATARVEDASGCEATCDCDNDGFLKIDCDAGEDASGKQPGDCDDLDPLRHPGAPYTAAEPVGHDGDWDCDGRIDKLPKPNLKCSGVRLLGCSGGSGFIVDPACGTTADYYSCRPGSDLVGTCVPTPTGETVTATCK